MTDASIGNMQAEVHETAKEHGWWDGELDWCSAANAPEDLAMARLKRVIPERLMLTCAEAAEGLEDYRVLKHAGDIRVLWFLNPNSTEKTTSRSPDKLHTKPVGFASEMADIVIRVMDLCEFLGIDLEEAILAKMAYNKTRPWKHGGKHV